MIVAENIKLSVYMKKSDMTMFPLPLPMMALLLPTMCFEEYKKNQEPLVWNTHKNLSNNTNIQYCNTVWNNISLEQIPEPAAVRIAVNKVAATTPLSKPVSGEINQVVRKSYRFYSNKAVTQATKPITSIKEHDGSGNCWQAAFCILDTNRDLLRKMVLYLCWDKAEIFATCIELYIPLLCPCWIQKWLVWIMCHHKEVLKWPIVLA